MRRVDEERLVADMIELTRQYGRYGYRRVAALLRDAGWHVNDKRVERVRREGLKVPSRQPKKGRLWLNDCLCVPLRPERRDHVWSYDFVSCRTDDGKAFRTLNIIDEYSQECLAVCADRKLNSGDYQGAADEFPRWVNAGGQPLPGLVRRRDAEQALFLNQDYTRFL